MKAPLGTEVDLGPGHIVLDGDPAPPQKGHSSPFLFGLCLLWPRSPISANAELVYSRYWLFKFKFYYSMHFYFRTFNGAQSVTL